MPTNSLQEFVEKTRASWGPLTSEVVADCQSHLQNLLRASPTEAWLAALHRDHPQNEELYRDPDRGFVLLAHWETAGLYRPPHDHGRSWVIYAMQDGAIEMGTYGRVDDPETGIRLVKRNSTLVSAGQVQVYLPGDMVRVRRYARAGCSRPPDGGRLAHQHCHRRSDHSPPSASPNRALGTGLKPWFQQLGERQGRGPRTSNGGVRGR